MYVINSVCSICRKARFSMFKEESLRFRFNPSHEKENHNHQEIPSVNTSFHNNPPKSGKPEDNISSDSIINISELKEKLCQDKDIDQKETFDSQLLIPEKYIRDDERNIIRFNKEGIYSLYETLNNNEGWDTIFDKENLKVSSRIGSIFDPKLYVIKTTYKLDKSRLNIKNKSLSFIGEIMYDPKYRKDFDKDIKEINVIDKGENFSIVCTWTIAPFVFSAERDVLDKRIEFTHNNKYFNFSSSIDNSVSPHKNVVRCKTFMNFFYMWEEDNFIVCESVGQYDFKSNIPTKFINMTVPGKTKDWYNKFIDYINSLQINEEIKLDS